MIRSRTIKELVKPIFMKKNVYSRFYDINNIVYIHIPKAAGTSICDALYGGDPWHYTFNELNLINPINFSKYKKVAFVRNPVYRMLSTYMYSLSNIRKYPHTTIKFMAEYSSFDDFIERGLTKDVVNNHYFFWKQTRYLSGNMDFIGKFENIDNDFKLMCEKFNLSHELPRKNVSANRDSKTVIKKENFQKILELYSDDFEVYYYETNEDFYTKLEIV